MKLLKTTSLALVPAAAAVLLLGATSAMAEPTQLCKADRDVGGVTEPCPEGEGITHVHAVDPLALLKAEGLIAADILCEALFLAEVLGLGSPQIIHGHFTFGPPHGTGTACVNMTTGGNCGTVKEVSAGGLLKALRTALELATAPAEGFEWLVECSGLHCVYTLTGLTFDVVGVLAPGAEGAGDSGAELKTVSGFACPTSTKLTTFLESLEPVYIAK